MKKTLKQKNEYVCSGVRPNAGLTAAYQKQLDKMLDEMQRSIVYWLTAAYRANPPENLATDAKYSGLPARVMQKVMKRLTTKWQKRFNDAAQQLATYFTTKAADRTDKTLKSILKRGGFSVEFKLTPAWKDAVQANINANVGLITNFSKEHLAQIEGMVMRSVAAGRDIGTLTLELQKRYDISRRRAKLIAHHQNNLATMDIQKVRAQELGIKEAIWRHSHGGAQPRPLHVQAGLEKRRYDPQEGCLIGGEYIFPGELINCRCYPKFVVKGLS